MNFYVDPMSQWHERVEDQISGKLKVIVLFIPSDDGLHFKHICAPIERLDIFCKRGMVELLIFNDN